MLSPLASAPTTNLLYVLYLLNFLYFPVYNGV